MSRTLQDQFIIDDEDEDLCPLCVEPFDLSDKSFRPCPCGYQVRLAPTLAADLMPLDLSAQTRVPRIRLDGKC
jgi:hypothetical protein